MPSENIEVNPSHPLWPATATTVTNPAWALLAPTGTCPSGDGVWDAGQAGMYAFQHAFIVPYALAGAGTTFSMRVYGWRVAGTIPEQQVWVPLLLAEFLCTVCEQPGPAPPFGTLAVRSPGPLERFCDTITLVQGAVGPEDGEVLSTGPGTDLIAFAVMEVRGCQKIQFDFLSDVPVSALWARA